MFNTRKASCGRTSSNRSTSNGEKSEMGWYINDILNSSKTKINFTWIVQPMPNFHVYCIYIWSTPHLAKWRFNKDSRIPYTKWKNILVDFNRNTNPSSSGPTSEGSPSMRARTHCSALPHLKEVPDLPQPRRWKDGKILHWCHHWMDGFRDFPTVMDGSLKKK